MSVSCVEKVSTYARKAKIGFRLRNMCVIISQINLEFEPEKT